MRYVAAADTACASLEGGAVLLHMGTKRYYSLNETGALVWQLLEEGEGATEGDVVTRLVDRYMVGSGEAGAAVAELLAELLAEGLVAVHQC
jgi:hypothetical protein